MLYYFELKIFGNVYQVCIVFLLSAVNYNPLNADTIPFHKVDDASLQGCSSISSISTCGFNDWQYIIWCNALLCTLRNSTNTDCQIITFYVLLQNALAVGETLEELKKAKLTTHYLWVSKNLYLVKSLCDIHQLDIRTSTAQIVHKLYYKLFRWCCDHLHQARKVQKWHQV